MISIKVTEEMTDDEQILQEVEEKILYNLKAETPVVTGKLRDSWVVRYDREVVKVSSDTMYARMVSVRKQLINKLTT